MGKKTAWTEPAKAELRAIDQATALRILHGMARYLATGDGDVKRLEDIEPPELRLRVGNLVCPLSRSRRFHRGPRRQTPPRSLPLTCGVNDRPPFPVGPQFAPGDDRKSAISRLRTWIVRMHTISQRAPDTTPVRGPTFTVFYPAHPACPCELRLPQPRTQARVPVPPRLRALVGALTDLPCPFAGPPDTSPYRLSVEIPEGGEGICSGVLTLLSDLCKGEADRESASRRHWS
jgi:hypothetical protein